MTDISVPPSSVLAPEPSAVERLRQDLLQPDALLDCLVEICRLHGHNATRASLAAGLPLGPEGRLTLELAERAAARAGMVTKLERATAAAVDRAALPAILLLKDNKACVLLGREEGMVRVLLPETGQGAVMLSAEEVARRSTGYVLHVHPHFRFDERTPEVRPSREGHWFWSTLLAQRAVYRDILGAAALINLFAIASPIFTMNVYDRVVPNSAMETLWTLAIGMVIVLGADLLLRKLRSRFVDEASARVDVQISARLMERVLGMRLEHRPESVGSFASNMRSFEQVRELIASTTVTALIDLPFALLFLLVIIVISPWLAIPVVVAFAAVLGFGWMIQGKLHTLSETTYRASATRNATLIESLTGIETIKTQGAEGTIQARWERANVFLSATNVKMRALSNGANYLTSTTLQMVTVVMVVAGVYLIGGRMLTMGGLIACSMLASRALAPAGQLVGLLMQYQGARTALQGLENFMAKPVERDVRADGAAYIHRASVRGDIEFREVSFQYPNRSDAAVDKLSFKIRAGERVALIGRVGSGKSTLQRLLMGLYKATSGGVMLDGIDLNQLDPADLRKNVGCVSQDVMLFYGSLRDNIAFGLPYADDASVIAAADVAGLSEFINRHPQGFDMNVGERGEFLSGGQRQAVGLARAVLHNTPVLLLDEPTSAMDFSTEAAVTRRLAEFGAGKTMVVATHRTSLLSMVDRVIVIDGGKIVADGPRDAMMEALQDGRITRAA
ncbi:type I secretion system permease/ATPase [Variovorax sp. KK3]|uniref:type I secretion system permease/ATPase n=1 Tax=Variovorax sp. KK3 TaxID=1855728 RepID=UPI00097BBCE5|nr:type I secretion system permease/ATPase [Variovorax sp. KK3]